MDRKPGFSISLGEAFQSEEVDAKGHPLAPAPSPTIDLSLYSEVAFAAKVISNRQVWIEMLDHRNLLSHSSDCAGFEKAVEALAARYLPALLELHGYFQAKSSE